MRNLLRYTRLFVVVLLAFVAASCAEQPSAPGSGTMLDVRPVYSASSRSIVPINRIVITARLANTTSIIGSLDRIVDPSLASWELPLDLTLTGSEPQDVAVSVELMHTDGITSSVEYSGVTTISVSAGQQRAVADIPLSPTAIAISTLTIPHGNIFLAVSKSLALISEARDDKLNLLTRTVTWTSSDTMIATVSSTGFVTARKPGTATITARADLKSASVTITVYTPAPTAIIRVSGDTQTVTVGKTAARAMVARVVDQNGDVIAGQVVQWVVVSGGGTMSPASSTSDALGIVQATYTAGTGAATARIEARATGLTGSPVAFTATVQPELPVATITIAPATRTLAGGDTVRLVPSAQDASGNTLSNVNYTWSSTDTLIAQVNSVGLVAARRPGVASVRATSNGKIGSSTITVTVGPAKAINVFSGNGQVAHTSTRLPADNVVKVIDTGGNGVANIDVTFTVIGGGGTVTPTTVRTDTAGLARTGWTLGSLLGIQSMQATAASLPGQQFVFTATGTGDIGVRRQWVGGNASSPDDWSTASNWSPAGIPSDLDSAVVVPTSQSPRLHASASVGTLTVQTGATVDNGGYDLSVGKLLSVNGSATGLGAFRVTGTNVPVRGTFSNLYISGSATATNIIFTTGDFIVAAGGQFTLAGFTVHTSGQFGVSGVLVLTNATDELYTRDFSIANTNETGKLTAGIIRVSGNFVNGCYNETEFNPTGTSVLMNGTTTTPQIISMCSSATGNRFATLTIAAGANVSTNDLVFMDTLVISGTLSVGPPGIVDTRVLSITTGGVLNNNGITRTNLPFTNNGTVTGRPVVQR